MKTKRILLKNVGNSKSKKKRLNKKPLKIQKVYTNSIK